MSFYSEVVPPGSVLEDENGIPEVIPIKSWAHGSPVKGGLRSGRIDSQLLITPRDENSYDTEGMLHYIPKDPDAEHDDDGGSAEDEEVDMENHPTEEDDEQEADEEQYEDDFKNDDEYDDLLNYLEEEEANEEGWERDKNPYDYQQTNHLNYTSAVTQKMGDHLSHFHADLECNYDDADDDLNNFEESQSQGEYEESEGSDREDNASPQFKFDETAYNAMVSAADDVIRKMSPRFQKFLKEDENDDDNDSNSSGSHQDHLMDIMSEYNELVSYLESPRGEEVKTKELNTGYKSPEKQQLIGKLIDAANTYLSDRKPKQKKAKATVKKSDSTKGNPVAGSSKNKPNYADKGQQKSDKIVSRMADLVDKGGLYVADSAKPKQKPPVNRGKSDAGEKHKVRNNPIFDNSFP